MPEITALPPRVALTLGMRARALACAGIARVLASPRLTRHPAWGETVLPRLLARTDRRATRAATHREAEHAVAVVVTAAPRLGGNTTCLPRALAAKLYCRTLGHTTAVVIAPAPDARAHAWIEADGRPAGEAADPTDRYVPVNRYGTPPPPRDPTPGAPGTDVTQEGRIP
ncbi:hypothetical protein B4N89_45530 [Embleya scabrispora]|uniref:Microcin J25-processing protein McjB C-terminal domain-containing protein n=1 Tax=Embleya scabrispora TaxID=159449 RepID=A0A1T3NIY0_9ACTN|nr:lasso peptide biosynthesis B2 protein [Embleya scabrispora]OPC76748.1 hypothetical protein B4N89_45530 [Embleya scabrispora]